MQALVEIKPVRRRKFEKFLRRMLVDKTARRISRSESRKTNSALLATQQISSNKKSAHPEVNTHPAGENRKMQWRFWRDENELWLFSKTPSKPWHRHLGYGAPGKMPVPPKEVRQKLALPLLHCHES